MKIDKNFMVYLILAIGVILLALALWGFSAPTILAILVMLYLLIITYRK